MLQSIHIQNFRCFEDFKAEGFERINLIGGKNNSGKTCLLEAVFSILKPLNLEIISQLRNQTSFDILNVSAKKGEFHFNFEYANQEFMQYSKLLLNSKIESSFYPTWINVNSKIITQQDELPKIDTSRIDVSDFAKLKPKFVEVLKLIDKRINAINIYIINSNSLDFKIQIANKQISIDSFGAATKSLIKYFTFLFEKYLQKSNEQSILLIDEIENGIHYTAHKEFWQHLFKLCKELNVQVFATTHSLEMIKAFNEVALKEGEAAYFEMFRNKEEIKCIKRDAEQLFYVIENDKAFRGE